MTSGMALNVFSSRELFGTLRADTNGFKLGNQSPHDHGRSPNPREEVLKNSISPAPNTRGAATRSDSSAEESGS